MAILDKIDSNITGLSYAEEASIGVLPGTPVWIPLEPNSYSDFGGTITTLARNPINPSRQQKKGVVTDLDATGGFNTDLTQTNLQDMLQGFFFADARKKGVEVPTSATVQAGDDTYEVAETAGFFVGSIVNATGLTDAANNGPKSVSAVTLDTSIAVNEVLVTEASPPTTSQLEVVGFEFTSADVDVDASGTYPAITTTTKDLTELGLTVGEWVFLGGDGASDAFVTAANNGFKRVKSIATNRMEFDKSDLAMVTETGTGLTIQIYIPSTLKNELGALIKRRTYHLERSLGAPDDALPSEVQGEYVKGAVPNEFTLNVSTADKLTADLSFVATDNEQVLSTEGLKSGTRLALIESDAFNTSSDFSRIKISEVVAGDEAPSPLFAFVTDASFSINNNVSSSKAVGVLGSCGVSVGTFQVSGSMTAYFSNVSAVQAVRQNKDITMDMAVVKQNAGFVVDIPLLSLGDGKPDVSQDEPITLPLSMDAATAISLDPNTDYTLMMCFFNYLPTLADT